MGQRVQIERHGTTLVLLYEGDATTINLPLLEEVWVLQIGDSFAGPNEQVILFVEKEGFVGVAANVENLLRLIGEDLQEMYQHGKLVYANASGLPRTWRTNWWNPFATVNIKPIRRSRSELDKEKVRWKVSQPNSYQDIFV